MSDAPTQGQDASQEPRTPTIIFVEDEVSHLAEIVTAIERYRPNWKYEIVENAMAGYVWLTANRASVIVLDVMLPGIEGVPELTEGAFLAAVIRNAKVPPDTWAGELDPVNRIAPVVLLTGRGKAGVKRDLQDLKLKAIEPAASGRAARTFVQEARKHVVLVEKASRTAAGQNFLDLVLRPLVNDT